MPGRWSRVVAGTAIFGSMVCLFAQQAQVSPASAPSGSAPAAVPSLDVISVKPNKSGSKGSSWGPTPDGVMGVNVPPHLMLTQAFDLNNDQVIGEPDWSKSERFDVNAKVADADADAARKLTRDQKRVFYQQVLKERFGLVAHRETRELPEYMLMVAKGGAKFQEGKPDTSAPPETRIRSGIRMSMRGGMRKLEIGDTAIPFILEFLSNETGRAVVNKTGLTGKYSFTLTWSPQMSAGGPRGGAEGDASTPLYAAPDLFTAIQEQLGLKLEPMKGPVDVVVIDHLERPGEN